MSFNKFFNENIRKMIDIFEEIGFKEAIKLTIDGKFMHYHWDVRELDDRAAHVVQSLHSETSNMLEMLLLSKIVIDGPKVFDVSQIDFEMLTEITINIPINEYNQPFPTIIIQLPPDFCKNRSVILPQAGTVLDGNVLPDTHEPDFCIIYHHKEFNAIVFGLFFNSAISMKTGFALREGDLIEKMMDQSFDRQFEDSMEASDGEKQLMDSLFRAAINYCLLIDEVGCHPLTNDHRNKLERYLENAKREGKREKIVKAARELRVLPIKYQLEQEVKLFNTVNNHADLSIHSGQHKSPHYRRGFYRMQACGPGRSEHKRIRINPVFVNSQFFFGKPSDTYYKAK